MAGPLRRAAVELHARTRTFVIHLRIESPWLAMGLAGTGLGAFYIHHSNSAPQPARENPGVLSLVTAVRNGLERKEADQIDPEVMRIESGSIVVELVCHTEQSFLMFMEDFEKGEIKQRLKTEFTKIGRTGRFDVTITNLDEVRKNLEAIRYIFISTYH